MNKITQKILRTCRQVLPQFFIKLLSIYILSDNTRKRAWFNAVFSQNDKMDWVGVELTTSAQQLPLSRYKKTINSKIPGQILPICRLIIHCFLPVNLLFNCDDWQQVLDQSLLLSIFCSNFDASKNLSADRTTIILKGRAIFHYLYLLANACFFGLWLDIIEASP